ncbi:right-handed parallel beta-helix repeat-containing protein [Caballeronia humi]|uniref:right-handed parallel beta-helix repeat-containing protein n=1 Tax=Caballeronia humi TaxID=326474 RepID=UPI001F2C045A|nr:right-handed parallel beta-helix repeat-containing protein [Caballeronia humi]
MDAITRPFAAVADVGTSQHAPADEVVDRWFGVRADGKTNDREALQKAVDSAVGKTLVITGSCRLDEQGLHMRSNSRLRFMPGASLKLLPHDSRNYEVIRIWDVRHVVLENPRVDGSKELNAATDGEWGMGISIAGSTDVTILSPTTTNCWGDGIYIANSFGKGLPYSSDVRVMNHYASGCRRQGVSIISGRNILFDHPVWENIAGTAPSAGLDIEPNGNTDVIENVRIVNPVTRNCQVGILVWLEALPGSREKYVSVVITGHNDEGSREAAYSVSGLKTKGSVVTGYIKSNSPTWIRPKRDAFVSTDYDRAGPRIDISNPTIIR